MTEFSKNHATTTVNHVDQPSTETIQNKQPESETQQIKQDLSEISTHTQSMAQYTTQADFYEAIEHTLQGSLDNRERIKAYLKIPSKLRSDLQFANFAHTHIPNLMLILASRTLTRPAPGDNWRDKRRKEEANVARHSINYPTPQVPQTQLPERDEQYELSIWYDSDKRVGSEYESRYFFERDPLYIGRTSPNSDSRKNFETMQDLVSRDGRTFQFASERLRDNKQLLLKALETFPEAIYFASPDLQNDYDACLAAVSIDGKMFHWISETLRDNKNILLEALESFPEAIYMASPRLQANDDVILKAVSKQGGTIQWVSEDARNNKDIILKAMETYPKALYWASVGLKDDSKFAEIVLARHQSEVTSNNLEGGGLLGYFSENVLRSNKGLIHTHIHGRFEFKNLPRSIKSDGEFILTLLPKHPEFILHVSNDLNENNTFLERAFQTNPEVLIALSLKTFRSRELLNWLEQRAQNR